MLPGFRLKTLLNTINQAGGTTVTEEKKPILKFFLQTLTVIQMIITVKD